MYQLGSANSFNMDRQEDMSRNPWDRSRDAPAAENGRHAAATNRFDGCQDAQLVVDRQVAFRQTTLLG